MMENVKNNQGFSLVEIIVALLISSVVMLSVMFIVSATIRNYQNTGAEATLQIEAQTAVNQIHDLLLEARACSFYPDMEQGTLVVLSGNDAGGYYYVVPLIADIGKLLFHKVVPEAGGRDLTSLTGMSFESAIREVVEEMKVDPDRYFLSRNVESFQITQQSKLVRITLSLKLQGKEFITTDSVTLRNGTQ